MSSKWWTIVFLVASFLAVNNHVKGDEYSEYEDFFNEDQTNVEEQTENPLEAATDYGDHEDQPSTEYYPDTDDQIAEAAVEQPEEDATIPPDEQQPEVPKTEEDTSSENAPEAPPASPESPTDTVLEKRDATKEYACRNETEEGVCKLKCDDTIESKSNIENCTIEGETWECCIPNTKKARRAVHGAYDNYRGKSSDHYGLGDAYDDYEGKEYRGQDIATAIRHAIENLGVRDALEKSLSSQGLYAQPYSSHGLNNEYLQSNEDALKAERKSYVVYQAIKFLSFK